MRPRLIWSLSLLCALGIFGAMGVITYRTLQLEQETALAARIRLALWRMEGEASAMMIAENNRPPEHYRAFYGMGSSDAVKQRSPLLGARSSHVRLHFEISPEGRLTSPQSPAGGDRTQAAFLGVDNDELLRADAALADLRKRLAMKSQWGDVTQSQVLNAVADGATRSAEFAVVPPDTLPKATPAKEFAKERSDLKQRTEQVQRQLAQGLNNMVAKDDSAISSLLMPAPGGQATPFRAVWLEDQLFLIREVSFQSKHWVQGVWMDGMSLRNGMLLGVADVLPNALLLPAPSLRVGFSQGKLLVLETPKVEQDPMSLVGLPLRLSPGAPVLGNLLESSSMRLTLLAAWAAAALAAVLASLLLWGVTRLSERRAAFVGSVTHELRTPLTTFRLYSEMLEQDLIPDEATRRNYLSTLRSESMRLTHLVDNVLAYSRIERGSRSPARELLELPQWLAQISQRLREHASASGLELQLHLPIDRSGYTTELDSTALERILFNLVDNACKYAAGKCAEPVIHLRLEQSPRWYLVTVADSGPGIPKSERAKLFSPFHKSADEAANSKPGVGLGLALCKRMAQAMGGDLSLLRGPGAVFEVKLRRTEKAERS
jgi:signal transduction histidine kinase